MNEGSNPLPVLDSRSHIVKVKIFVLDIENFVIEISTN